MMKLFKNIKFRLLAGLFAFLFIVFYAFGYLLIHALEDTYTQSIESTLITATKDLQHEFNVDLNNSHEFEDVKNEFDMSVLYSQVVVIEKKNGTIFASSKDLKGYQLNYNTIDISTLQKDSILFTTQSIKQLSKKRLKVATTVLKKTKDKTIILQCAIPYQKHNPYITQMKTLVIIGLLTLLAIILFVVYFMLSKSLLETKLVIDEVKNIKIDGNPHHIKPTAIASEIDELIETFNMLIDDLQSSYKKVKDFGQNASHELKTPLTIIRGEIEVGLRKERKNEEYKEILNSTLSEVQLLQDTIEKILFLSSSIDSDIIKTFEEIYIDEILSESIEEKSAFAKTKNISLKVLDLEPLTKLGNHSLLKIAFSNLLDNAIKYSPCDSQIFISCKGDIVTIEDFGCGIPQNEIEKIFDRFYRVDKVRNHTQGNGLGLSIVKNILTIHNFTITLKSVENQYTKVEICG